MRCSLRSVLTLFVSFSFAILASGSLFAAPVISNLNPTSGATGTSVIITGTGFGSSQGSSTVKFGGVVASVTNWSNTGTSITATVPSGTANGNVGVIVTVSGTASNSATFTVTNPVISGLSINSAPVDQEITINGSNFGASQGVNSSVTFNGTTGVPSYWSASPIVVPVPTGATTGNIVLTVNGNAAAPVMFMVTPAPQPPGVHFIQGNYNITLPHTNSPFVSMTTPFPIEQTAGDLNVVLVGWHDTTVAINSVTDSAGNTYTLAVSGTQGGVRSQYIYYAKNIAGVASSSVTVTFNSTPTRPEIRIGEYSGLDQTSPLDVVKSSTGTGSTADSGSATTTNANDLLIGGDVVDGLTTTPGTGYTNRVITTTLANANSDIFEDKIVTSIGSYNATAVLNGSHPYLMQMVAFKEAPNQAPVVNAGPNQTITLPTNTATLDGTATDDGRPNNTLTLSWTKVSGPGTVTFSSPSTASTQATFSTFGTYVLQLTANDSQLSSSSNVTVTVNSQPISLSLTPISVGPNVTGTTQTMTALLKNGTGPTSVPISSVSVSFTITGANATSGNATTNSSGIATFTYTGAHSGSDAVTASYTGQNSNSANVGWITPAQDVSSSTILGRFFTSNDGSGAFSTLPTATPVFSQFFPTIDFNPPSGTVPGTPPSINVNTRPFTDVTTDINGNFTGSIVAQGNGYQAGLGTLDSFQAVFTGTFTVATAGNKTINFNDDDGFIVGIGGGATRVSGPMVNSPTSGLTAFTGLTVVGAYNTATAPVANAVVVNFPSPGSYAYEVDYSECCSGQDVLTMTVGGTNSPGVPPSGSLYLSPISPSSLATGQTQSFTVLVTDASGAAIQNASVNLIVMGANQRQLTAATDSTGTASFQYTGTNAGTDNVQASATVSGMGAYSNLVNMPWTVAQGSGAITFVPQGWIGSPATGITVTGQTPITVAPGVNLTSGTLTYWPTSNPAAVTTLNSNTTGSGTIGTIDGTLLANGGYTIQLNATASNGTTQVSQINVVVVGDYKPGRITSTVTEFKVPLAGIPISITRTYDSLERSQIEDFGFGWRLGTTFNLTVDSKFNVTFDFGNGQRETFYFNPQPSSFFTAWLSNAQYTPQPGLHGSLASNGCPGIINIQGTWHCFGPGFYQPTTYAYTDPSGRVYTISASGQLQSIRDLNGNTLTVTSGGITSSVNGVVIPFVRDGSGRITQISDLSTPANNYTYTYDGSGNLQSVQYPGLTQAETYTYATDHSLLTETDPRGNTSSAVYYSAANDGGNTLLDGRLFSITDTMQQTTSFSYTLSTNTTTTTFPDTGVQSRTDDSFGKPLSITDPLNRNTTYAYDSNENVISMVDPLQNPATTYTYDANGFQTSIHDPLGHTSTKTYNQFGGVLTEADAANTNTRTTTYDGNFNSTGVTDLLPGSPQVSNSTFDALGNLLTLTDANNKTTQFAYDPNGNLIQVTDALNQVTHYGYDAMGRVISQTDPLNNTTTFTFDALGRVKTKTDALNKTTTYVYDNNGNKTSETDANNHTISYQYDNMNRVTKITYPDTTFKTFAYDFRGNKLTEVDQSGRTTMYVYDLAGQLSTMTYAFGTQPPDLGVVQYTYDLDGRQKTVKDELNNTTTNNYDAAGRLTSVQDALTHVTNYGYDNDNRKTSAQDANLNTTSYAYDARSRLTTITYPATATQGVTTTQNTYDGMGRQLTTTDQASKVTTKTYDAVGRLLSVKDALNNLTNYFYDANGNLTFLQDAAGRVTSYQYDKLNRRIVRTLPLNQAENYTYDPVGNLATKTDFNGLKTTYSYDTLNRLLSKVPTSGTGISFTYTPTGQRLTMTDPSGTTNYSSYDNRDRLLTKATPEGTLTYTYDAHGNVLSIISSNANGASLGYQYDAVNRLFKVCDNRIAPNCGTAGVTTYSYDPAGNLLGYAYPNTVQTANTFDTLNRLTQVCVGTGAPTCTASPMAKYTYTLGNAGNRTNVLELNSRNVAYGYDNDYRLQSEAITADPGGNNGSETYTYDVVGNRFSLTSTIPSLPGTMNYSYDANDRLTTDVYDANGNTTSSAGISNTYDFENRMLSHGSVTLAYDGDGNRVSETVGGSTTKFLVDSLNPTKLPQVLDEIVSGSVTRTYAYGLQRISENQQIGGNWTPSFYGYDGHGNVRFLTNSAGAITDAYTYDAFGMQIAHTGTTPNVFQYSGEWLDSSVGLYYLRARYLNQATGRFWAMDCCEGDINDPATLNKYVYAQNDPINRLDPTGKATFAEWSIQVNNRVYSIGIHSAVHPWTILGVKFWCVHLQLLTYISGGPSGNQWRQQIPLIPLCSTVFNWF